MWESQGLCHPREQVFFGYLGANTPYQEHATIFETYDLAEIVLVMAQNQKHFGYGSETEFAIVPHYE